MPRLRILAFAGSARTGSLNERLIRLAAAMAADDGVQVDHVAFGDFAMPVYDGDLEREQGLPEGAQRLRQLVDQADGVIVAAPEYNYGVSAPVKNAFDWVSRARPMPWKGKSVLLMSASPSRNGGIRGLVQLRQSFEGCGSLVFPDMFALAHANRAFDDDGRLVDEETATRLRRMIRSYLQLALMVAPVCNTAADGRFDRSVMTLGLESESGELQPQLS